MCRRSCDGASECFVGLKANLTVLFPPNETNRQLSAQFAPFGPVADPVLQPRTKDLQFCLAHRAFQAGEKAVVEQRRMAMSQNFGRECD